MILLEQHSANGIGFFHMYAHEEQELDDFAVAHLVDRLPKLSQERIEELENAVLMRKTVANGVPFYGIPDGLVGRFLIAGAQMGTESDLMVLKASYS